MLTLHQLAINPRLHLEGHISPLAIREHNKEKKIASDRDRIRIPVPRAHRNFYYERLRQ